MSSQTPTIISLLWLSNWSASTNALPIIQFQINGTLIGPVYNLSPVTATWEQFNAVWNSGSNTTATICINDQQTGAIGNDFALDDISFRQTCKVTDSIYVKKTAATNVINDYAAVLATGACNTLIVDDPTVLQAGDTVLMIQMKGATVDTSNTAAFGTILNYNNVGNYEYNEVLSISGNTVTLKYAIQRPYNIPGGKVQLVTVPQFTNYTVTDTLTALPWNGSKGGIVVFGVDNTLTLSGPIDVTGKGFRGGGPLNQTYYSCNQPSYFYNASSNNGGQKGEGIAEVGADKNYGRGPLANGGGGGNNTNAGGGGGSNVGAGGMGGNQWGGCSGAIFNNGLPGVVLSNANDKIFLGGGGGAGHGNDLGEGTAGSGGGIVMIRAGSIIGNSNFIMASGSNGFLPAYFQGGGINDDGTGGGGGGGSVLLQNVTNYNSLSIEAKGGNGTSFPSAGFPEGPGGGGGGGLIWYNTGSSPAGSNGSTTGGANGVVTNGANPYGAMPGNSGQNAFNFPYVFPTTLAVGITADFQSTPISCLILSFSVTNPSAGSTYAWNFGVAGTSTSANPTITFPAEGSYPVTLIVNGTGGCSDTITKIIVVGPCKKVINAYAAVLATGPLQQPAGR